MSAHVLLGRGGGRHRRPAIAGKEKADTSSSQTRMTVTNTYDELCQSSLEEDVEMTAQQMEQKVTMPGTQAAAPVDVTIAWEGNITEIIPIGPVPEGLRLDVHFAGTVVEGPLSGTTIRGIDYVLLRADGVGVIDVREVFTTPAGERIAVRPQGYLQMPAALPPVEALTDPAFQWPDMPVPLIGVAFCQTAAPDLAWLNRTPLAFTGTANLGTGRMHIAVRALSPEMVLGGNAAPQAV